jgi:hypothetical protein
VFILIVLAATGTPHQPSPETASSPEAKATAQTKEDTEEEKECHSEQGLAFVIAEDFVKKQLKAPSTAKFAPKWESTVTGGDKGCKYEITSWVDSQNSYGAQIRTEFQIVVKYAGNHQWQLVSLHFAK